MRGDSDRARDCYHAGMTAFGRGDLTQAAELLREAIGLAPENAVYQAHVLAEIDVAAVESDDSAPGGLVATITGRTIGRSDVWHSATLSDSQKR
jgi:hypothetical protein